MKRFAIFLFVGSIFVSLQSVPSFAASKAGTLCAKVGSTLVVQGKKYTCLKSGAKLIWNKGVVFAPSTMQSTTVMTKFSPWSNPVNTSQELIAFHDNIDSWFKSATIKKIDLNIYIDPRISGKQIKWISDSLIFQAQLTGSTSPSDYKIFIGRSDDWVISKRKSLDAGLETWNPKYVCYEDSNEGCADPVSRRAFFVWNASSLLTATEDWQFTRALGHEFFHITQCDLIGDPQKCGVYFNLLPSWLAEGGPNVIGAIFADHLGNLTYEEQRKSSLLVYQGGKNGANTPLSEFSKNIRFGELFPYEIGMLACEYLIASTSMQAFLDFYSNLPTSSSFEETFQKSFGIPVNKFYEAFDSARVNLGFYPVGK